MKINAHWFKSGVLALVCLCFTLQLFAQATRGNGKVVEQDRDISGFNAIKVSDGIDLFITQGGTEAVKVKADENLLDKVVTRLEGQKLIVEVKGSIRQAEALDVYVTIEDLEALYASGGSDVYAEEGLTLDELKLYCSGGSDTHLKLEVGTLYCQTSGGSDAILSGQVDNMEIETSGGSDFRGKDLKAINCKLRTSGGSDARVYVTGEIEMDASGASDIFYKGGAKVIRQRSSGGSDIHSM